MKKVAAICIVVGALGAMATNIKKYIGSPWIKIRIENIQKSTLFRTAKIIRKILSC